MFDTVAAIRVYDVIRAFGGALFLSGAIVMFYNVWMTVRQGTAAAPAPDALAGAAPAAAGGR